MARFSVGEVDNYKVQGASDYFSLANDKDYEEVRLMYNDMEDVQLYSVHEIEVNGKTVKVNCLREYDQPLSDCPLCAAGNKLQVKMWVPLYLTRTSEVKVWERGRTFVSKLESAARRHNPLVSARFEIERNGKKGDQQTTYELMFVEKDGTQLQDLPPLPEIEGTILKNLTKQQMQEYLQTGTINDLAKEQKSVGRNPQSDRRPSSQQEPVVRRRTRASEPTPEITDENIPF